LAFPPEGVNSVISDPHFLSRSSPSPILFYRFDGFFDSYKEISIYMASAAPDKDDGHKNQPSSELVPHSAELI
jgi:hypothetical protein